MLKFVLYNSHQIQKKMKKIIPFLAALFMFSAAQAQTKTTEWPELKAFHTLMSETFHAAEVGNLAPLKEKKAELYRASKVWYAAEVPANFDKEKTTATLKKLMIKCNDIWYSIEKKEADEKITKMITEAHDLFHTVVGECKKH
jgi:hypothetical protein